MLCYVNLTPPFYLNIIPFKYALFQMSKMLQSYRVKADSGTISVTLAGTLFHQVSLATLFAGYVNYIMAD